MSKRWFYAAVFACSFVVVGVIDALMGTIDDPVPPTFAPHGFLIMFLSFAWCKADVRENGFPMPAGSALISALLPLIGVPLHLYRTRRFKRASLALLKGIGVFAGSLLVSMASVAVTEVIAG